MTDLALSVDEKMSEKLRKRALEWGTSVNQMAWEYRDRFWGVREKQQRARKFINDTYQNKTPVNST